MASRLRPRTVSELVDVEFELLRRHYLSFLTIVAAGFAPILVLAVGAGVAAGLFSGVKHGDSLGAPWIVAIFVAVFVALAFMLLLQGAIIHAASDAYLDDVVSVPDAFRRSAARVPTTLGAYVVMAVVTLVGYVCLIVPGVWAYAGMFAMPAIVLLEERGPGEAMRRSFALTKGRKLPVLGALIVAGMIAFGCRMTFSVAGAVTGSPGMAVATQILGFVLFYPLTTIMAVLLYYDARIRFEGFDIERAAMALETTPAA